MNTRALVLSFPNTYQARRWLSAGLEDGGRPQLWLVQFWAGFFDRWEDLVQVPAPWHSLGQPRSPTQSRLQPPLAFPGLVSLPEWSSSLRASLSASALFQHLLSVALSLQPILLRAPVPGAAHVSKGQEPAASSSPNSGYGALSQCHQNPATPTERGQRVCALEKERKPQVKVQDGYCHFKEQHTIWAGFNITEAEHRA